MEINGLPLPPLLIEMIQNGRWKTPADPSPLRTLTGLDGFTLLSLDLMRSETDALRRLFEIGAGDTYWLGSSRGGQKPILAPNILDIDLMMVLGGTWHEDGICLDYRRDRLEPAVVASDWQLYRGWRVIAPNFDAFARLIGL